MYIKIPNVRPNIVINCLYPPITTTNYIISNIPTGDEDKDVTVITSKYSDSLEEKTIYSGFINYKYNKPQHMANQITTNLHMKNTYVVSYSIENVYFVLWGAPVTHIQSTKAPLSINLPGGYRLNSTLTYKLDIPWLPNNSKEAHVVPFLSHTSLILCI